jgi:hypothetical protein
MLKDRKAKSSLIGALDGNINAIVLDVVAVAYLNIINFPPTVQKQAGSSIQGVCVLYPK